MIAAQLTAAIDSARPALSATVTDRRDIDALVALFVDDVRVGRDSYGRAALHANLSEQLRAIGVSILSLWIFRQVKSAE